MSNLPSSQPQLESSGHKKRRALGCLVPVLALTSLLRKVKAARASRRLEAKTGSTKSSWRISFKKKVEQQEEEYNSIDEEEYYYTTSDGDEEEKEGIWQRSILMGDKCKPLEFSGAIYYDENGNKLEEMPQRTPRAILMNSQDKEEEEEEAGVWQRAILMGGKCQPLEYSGIIRYDEKGRRLDEMTPTRASPLQSFMSRTWIK